MFGQVFSFLCKIVTGHAPLTKQELDNIRRTATVHIMRAEAGIAIHSVMKDGVIYVVDVIDLETAKARLAAAGKLKS